MNFEDIANRVNQAAIQSKGRPLKDVERIVLKGAWENQTYGAIASAAVGYTEDYLKKDVGPKLWKLLSDIIDQQGVRVTKRNIQNVLQHWALQTPIAPDPTSEDHSPPNFSSSSSPYPGLGASMSSQQSAAGLSSTDLQAEPSVLVANLVRANQASPAAYEVLDTVANGHRSLLPVWDTPRIDTSDFEGRQGELRQLSTELQDETCRLLVLWGLEGIGKTSLAAQLVPLVQANFARCGYVSLAEPPALDVFLHSLLAWCQPTPAEQATNGQQPLDRLLHALEQQRYLLVIDDVEALFAANHLAGTYQTAYADYQTFLRQIAEAPHQSCLLWIAQEKPADLVQFEGQRVRSYHLQDFSLAEAQVFLQQRGATTATPDTWQAVMDLYGGSPQGLKELAATLKTVFQGNPNQLLEHISAPVKTATGQNLERLLQRLTPEELDVLYWLALAHDSLTLEDLNRGMMHSPNPAVIQSLIARSLCQVTATEAGQSTELTLSRVVQTVVIAQALAELLADLQQRRFGLFNQVPLLRTTAQESVQLRQKAAVLGPLAASLRQHYASEADMLRDFQHIHQQLRLSCTGQKGYAPGNFINLCQVLGINLNGIDFSGMTIWQGNLRHLSLQGTDLSEAEFVDTLFATALGRDPVAVFSQDGQFLATGDHEGRLLIWELPWGRLVRVLDDGISPSVRALAFSPEGDLLVVGTEQGELWLWPLTATYEADGLFEHVSAIRALAFNASGDWLASGEETGKICIWNLAAGMPEHILEGHQGPVCSLQFSADGQQLLSTSEDQQVYLWDLTRMEPVTVYQARSTAWLRAAGFMPPLLSSSSLEDSSEGVAVAVGYEDHCLTLWDVVAGQARRIFPMDITALPAMALSPDGRYLACSRQDCTVALWDVVNRCCLHVLRQSISPVWSLQFSPDSCQLATGSDYAVKIWDVRSGNCLRSLISQRYPVRCLAFTQDSTQLVTGHEDSVVRFWQIDLTGTFASQPRSFQGHEGQIRAIAVSPDGQWLASSAEDQTVRLWQRETGRCDRPLMEQRAAVTALTFTVDSRQLIIGDDHGQVQAWDVTIGSPAQGFHGHTSASTVLSVSEDGRYLVSGSRDCTVRVWDLATGDCTAVLEGHRRQVHAVCLSPDGERLISASRDGTARLWDLRSGQCLKIWQHPKRHWLHGVLIDPFGRALAFTGTPVVDIWCVEEETLLTTLLGHTHQVWHVQSSPDRHYLATTSHDDEIRIWQLDGGICQQVLRPDRPYEGVNIRGATGLSAPEKQMLRSLGAVECY